MKTPIPILLLLDRLDLGGGARRIQVYCEGLDRRRFTPVVAVRAQSMHRSLDSVIGTTTPRLFSRDPDEILAFAKQHGVKVWYFWYDGQYHEDLYTLLAAAKQAGSRLIGNNVFSYYDLRMDDLCDIVLFQTKFMRYKFARVRAKGAPLPFSKYCVLPNPVYDHYYRQFALTASARREVRAQLGFLPTQLVVGRFGRNDIVKWGDVLLQTIWASRSAQRLAYLLVGVPRSRRVLLRLLGRLFPSLTGRIVILSPTSDDRRLFALMQACDVIGHSVKIGEGCSNAINEAMYWGKPVITNPTPHCDNGQVEQVTHARSGYVARGVSEWGEYLRQLADQSALRRRLGAAATAQVRKHCEAATVVAEFERIITLALGGKAKPTAITVDQARYRQFVRSYETNARLSAPLATPSRTAKLVDYLVRIAGYVEYRCCNG